MQGFIHVSNISWILVLIQIYVDMTKENIAFFYLAWYSDKQCIVSQKTCYANFSRLLGMCLYERSLNSYSSFFHP